MPIIRYTGGPIFYGANAAKDAHDFEIAEAKAGDVMFYQRHRKEIMAEFEAASRARDAFVTQGKERVASLGERISAARAKQNLSDEIPARGIVFQHYARDLMY